MTPGRSIPPGGVARRLQIPDLRTPRALASGRRAPGFTPRPTRLGHWEFPGVPKLLVYHAISQLGMLVAVCEVERQPDQEPDPEPFPGLARQALHDEQAGSGGGETHQPYERHAEGARPVRFLVAQHQDAD